MSDLDLKLRTPITILLPTFNNVDQIDECLKSIEEQDFPKDKIEILVIDGGSRDGTVEIAKTYGCRIVKNPEILAGPGYALGVKEARGDVVMFLAADNRPLHRRWLRDIIEPLAEDSSIVGSFGPFIPDRHDIALNRYFCLVDSTPFHYFLCPTESIKRLYPRSYAVLEDNGRYKILDFRVEKFPILGLGNGFAVNFAAVPDLMRSAFREEVMVNFRRDLDDILPVIRMIQRGWKIAYVPEAGIHHYHLASYRQFLEKYSWKIRTNVYGKGLAYTNSRKYLSRKRRVRERMWSLYSLSFLWPLVHALPRFKEDREVAWLLHPLICLLLTLIGIVVALQHPVRAFKYFRAFFRAQAGGRA